MSGKRNKRHSGRRKGPRSRSRQAIRDEVQAVAWKQPDPMNWVPGDGHLGGRMEPKAPVQAAEVHDIRFHRGNGMPLAARCDTCPDGWSLGIADGHAIRAFIRVLCEHEGFAVARAVVAEAFDSLQYLEDRQHAA
jgi:hypothetical protein